MLLYIIKGVKILLIRRFLVILHPQIISRKNMAETKKIKRDTRYAQFFRVGKT